MVVTCQLSDVHRDAAAMGGGAGVAASGSSLVIALHGVQ
jgi:hypothetical protein